MDAGQPLLRQPLRHAVGIVCYYGVNACLLHLYRFVFGVNGVRYYAHAVGLGLFNEFRIYHGEVGTYGVGSEAWAGRSP